MRYISINTIYKTNFYVCYVFSPFANENGKSCHQEIQHNLLTMLFQLVLALAFIGVISGETLLFSEDWSKGIDFSLWKHEVVSSN